MESIEKSAVHQAEVFARAEYIHFLEDRLHQLEKEGTLVGQEVFKAIIEVQNELDGRAVVSDEKDHE